MTPPSSISWFNYIPQTQSFVAQISPPLKCSRRSEDTDVDSSPEKRVRTAEMHETLAATQRQVEKRLREASVLPLSLPLSDPPRALNSDEKWEKGSEKYLQACPEKNHQLMKEAMDCFSGIEEGHPKFPKAQYLLGRGKIALAEMTIQLSKQSELYKEALRCLIAASYQNGALFWQGICEFKLAELQKESIEEKKLHAVKAIALLSKVFGDRYFEARYTLGKCKFDLAEVEMQQDEQQKLYHEAIGHFSSIPITFASTAYWKAVCNYKLACLADPKQKLIQEAMKCFSRVVPDCPLNFQDVQDLKRKCWEACLTTRPEEKQSSSQCSITEKHV